MKRLLMLLMIVGMLIGAGSCEKTEPNEPDFITIFPPITKVVGGRDWEDVIQSMQDDELPLGAPAPAVPFVPAIKDVKNPRHYEIQQHDEALVEAEREFDEHLAEKARIEKEKEARAKREKEAVDKLVVNQSMFSIFLGETIDSLRSRTPVTPSGYAVPDNDYPGVIWEVYTSNLNVKLLHIRVFEQKIYMIEVQFADGSKANYETIKFQLEKKYKDNDDSLFGDLFGEVSLTVTIDAVKVYIKLNHDTGFMEDDKLELTYVHNLLRKQVQAEFHKRKADKISNEL